MRRGARKHEETVEREGEQKKKTERPRTGKPVEREKKTTQGDTQRQGTNERKRETKGETVVLRHQ